MRWIVLLFAVFLLRPQEIYASPAWAQGQVLYEVNLETFSKAGNFKGLEARLDDLKALGVGILWLMPIYERGTLKAFGSPYCVRDYEALYAPYGSSDDFRALVAHAHRLGLHIVLDWVGNHSSWDNALIQRHPEYYLHGSDGTIEAAKDKFSSQVWADVAQLDYSQPGLRQYMLGAMESWVRNYDIDGFRCDAAWGIPMDFWIKARRSLNEIRPIFLLAESSDPANAQAFDADYNFDLMNTAPDNLMVGLSHERRGLSDLLHLLRREYFDQEHRLEKMNFSSNHDDWKQNGSSYERLGDARFAMASLCFLLPGRPLIYNGQEIDWRAREGAIKWPSDLRGNWDWDFYQALCMTYQESPALQQGRLELFEDPKLNNLLFLERVEASDRVLGILNLSSKPLSLNFKDLFNAGSLHDLLAKKEIQISAGQGVKIHFDPWQCKIFRGAGILDLRVPQAAMPFQAQSLEASADSLSQAAWVGVEGLASGTAGPAKAAFRCAWNPEGLLCEAHVFKPKVVHEGDDGSPWNSDSVEFYFNMTPAHTGPYDRRCFQYIVGFGNPRLFESWGRTQGVRFASKLIDDGYQVDLDVPWTSLDLKPQIGQSFAFDVGVNLASPGKGRTGDLMWSGDDQNFRDSKLFGRLTLVNSSH